MYEGVTHLSTSLIRPLTRHENEWFWSRESQLSGTWTRLQFARNSAQIQRHVLDQCHWGHQRDASGFSLTSLIRYWLHEQPSLLSGGLEWFLHRCSWQRAWPGNCCFYWLGEIRHCTVHFIFTFILIWDAYFWEVGWNMWKLLSRNSMTEESDSESVMRCCSVTTAEKTNSAWS